MSFPDGIPNVLVVEDEMMLRMRAVDIVEDAGFRSVEAIDADQALSLLEARSDISLLFTDIQMPGSMDGLTLAHAVHARWRPSRSFWFPDWSHHLRWTGQKTVVSSASPWT